ncbi:MAG: hypothetical protein WCH01_12415 [Methylococcaceae bacterium]
MRFLIRNYPNGKQTDEEWIVCNTEVVPSNFDSDYELSSAFFAYLEFIANTHLEQAVIAAGLYLGLDLLHFKEAYRGK